MVIATAEQWAASLEDDLAEMSAFLSVLESVEKSAASKVEMMVAQ